MCLSSLSYVSLPILPSIRAGIRDLFQFRPRSGAAFCRSLVRFGPSFAFFSFSSQHLSAGTSKTMSGSAQPVVAGVFAVANRSRTMPPVLASRTEQANRLPTAGGPRAPRGGHPHSFAVRCSFSSSSLGLHLRRHRPPPSLSCNSPCHHPARHLRLPLSHRSPPLQV